jgi:hypothetical protein
LSAEREKELTEMNEMNLEFLTGCKIVRDYSEHYYEVKLRDGKVAIVPKEFVQSQTLSSNMGGARGEDTRRV